MYWFVVEMYHNSINPEEDDEWNRFDTDVLDSMLEKPFFDEYNRTRRNLENWCRRKYLMLDVYCFVKLQAFASTMLPKEYLWDVQYIWLREDLIEQISGLGWYDCIATIYKSYGIHWFTNNAENDPVLYKWACYAISACNQSGLIDSEVLKKDLSAIYRI